MPSFKDGVRLFGAEMPRQRGEPPGIVQPHLGEWSSVKAVYPFALYPACQRRSASPAKASGGEDVGQREQHDEEARAELQHIQDHERSLRRAAVAGRPDFDKSRKAIWFAAPVLHTRPSCLDRRLGASWPSSVRRRRDRRDSVVPSRCDGSRTRPSAGREEPRKGGVRRH